VEWTDIELEKKLWTCGRREQRIHLMEVLQKIHSNLVQHRCKWARMCHLQKEFARFRRNQRRGRAQKYTGLSSCHVVFHHLVHSIEWAVLYSDVICPILFRNDGANTLKASVLAQWLETTLSFFTEILRLNGHVEILCDRRKRHDLHVPARTLGTVMQIPGPTWISSSTTLLCHWV
jgi:hypothetical protein